MAPVLLALLAVLLPAAAGSASPSAVPGFPATEVAGTANPLAYWTPERMRAADPLPPRAASTGTGSATTEASGPPVYVAPADAGEQPGATLRRGAPLGVASAYSPGDERVRPNRIHGRVFATSPSDGDYTCSGTAVNSPGRSLVVTAGHCIYLYGEWGVNFMFVPGYRDGRSPFGRWAATKLRAPPQWIAAEDISFDIGMVTVSRNLSGRAVQDVVGARGIGFNQPRNQTYTSFGYPAEMPFDGESLQACRSQYQGDDPSTGPPRTMKITCDMNGGASGGGWVSHNTLLSVNSYCTGLVLVCLDVPQSLYGPYFSNEAKSLYLQARGKASRCGGRLSPNSAARAAVPARWPEARRDQPAGRKRRSGRRWRPRCHLRRPRPRRASRRPRPGCLHRRPRAGHGPRVRSAAASAVASTLNVPRALTR